MSQFVPETFISTTVAPAPVGQPGGGMSAIVRTQMMALLADPISNVPAEFKKWLEDYFAINGQDIPVSQISGFTQFTAQVAAASATTQTRTVTSWGDLATVGPQLTGIPDGSYIIAFGCQAWNDTTGGSAEMCYQANSVTVDNTQKCLTFFDQRFGTSIMRMSAVTLSNSGNNTITAKYQCSGVGGAPVGTANFGNRWMIALRYSNA